VPMIHVPDVRAPVAFGNAKILFEVEDGETVGLTFIQDGYKMRLGRE
jgi:hypothetical protein